MNVIVNWFTLLIVFVFDLAIAMVIALNKLIGRHDDNDTAILFLTGMVTLLLILFMNPLLKKMGKNYQNQQILDDNRRKETELEQEEVQEVLEEVEETTKVEEEVERVFEENQKVELNQENTHTLNK